MIGYLIFYKPPCGRWYVLSHKIYPSIADAKAAIRQFLPPETPTSVRAIDLAILESAA